MPKLVRCKLENTDCTNVKCMLFICQAFFCNRKLIPKLSNNGPTSIPNPSTPSSENLWEWTPKNSDCGPPNLRFRSQKITGGLPIWLFPALFLLRSLVASLVQPMVDDFRWLLAPCWVVVGSTFVESPRYVTKNTITRPPPPRKSS